MFCRAEVIHETLNAPRRRVDNEISRLTEAVSALLMHCQIVDKVLATYQDRLWRARYISALSVLCSIGLSMGVSYLCDALGSESSSESSSSSSSGNSSSSDTRKGSGDPNAPSFKIFRSKSPVGAPTSAAPSGDSADSSLARSLLGSMFGLQSKMSVVFVTSLMGTVASCSVAAWEYLSLEALLSSFSKQESFEAIYLQLYHKALKMQDEFTIGMGQLVIRELPGNVDTKYISEAPRVRMEDFLALERILNEDIAKLRRQVSPSYPLVSTFPSANATASWYQAARSALPVHRSALSSFQSVQQWAAALLGEHLDGSKYHGAGAGSTETGYCTPLKAPYDSPFSLDEQEHSDDAHDSDVSGAMDADVVADLQLNPSSGHRYGARQSSGRYGAHIGTKSWHHDSYHPAHTSGATVPQRNSLRGSHLEDDAHSINTRSTLSGMTSIEAFISASCGNPEDASLK